MRNTTARIQTPGIRRHDHRSACIGCGESAYDACGPDCQIEALTPGAGVVLRGAAQLLDEWCDGARYDVHTAVLVAAELLIGPSLGALLTADLAHDVLVSHICEQPKPAGGVLWAKVREVVPDQTLLHTYGAVVDKREIVLALYAASAAHEGWEFDPDEFEPVAA